MAQHAKPHLVLREVPMARHHGGPMDLHLRIDPTGPRRAQLEQQLREAIRDGRLRAGTRLPPTRELAAELGVSRGVAVEAYEQLVAEGWLVARRGSGTRVAERA